MRLNVAKSRYDTKTHEGAPALTDTPERELRRAVLACLLWEDQFYESGKAIADRITELAHKVKPADLAALTVEARTSHNLRHVPLLLLTVLAKAGAGGAADVSGTVEKVVQRADELGELLSIYWRDGRKPIPAAFKRGLALAARKFSAYSLGKYDRDNAAVKLRDVLFLTHAKPKDGDQAETWKKLIAGELESPDTWEVALSGGADKRETFTRLLTEGKLGYLALLRNLRNMTTAGVDDSLIREALVARKGAERVFPFRYVAAARACPQMEPALDQALCEAIAELPLLAGKTAILVDVSGSMDYPMSGKSDMKRIDAAAALASIAHGDLRVFTFSQTIVEVPPRRGMAGVDAVIRSQPHGSTYLGAAVNALNEQVPHDRLIVITDDQSHDAVPAPKAKRAYMINVASYKPSVAYGPWTKIEGFSENVLRYITAAENDIAATD